MNRWLTFLAIVCIVIGLVVSFWIKPKKPQVEVIKVERQKGTIKKTEIPKEKKPPHEGKAPIIALVLDDFGYEERNLDILGKIDVPMTLAVLPNAPYTKAVCSFAKKEGFEVIVHLPMEPEDLKESLEKDTITTSMDNETIACIMKKAFKDVVYAKGISNHMGSKATSDKSVITAVFKELKSRNLFFLDSFTTDKSVCGTLAKNFKLPYARRDVFIDNKLDKKYIRGQLAKVKEIAIKNGKAIAIGHDRTLTINVLREVIPSFKDSGIRFVRVSEVVKR